MKSRSTPAEGGGVGGGVGRDGTWATGFTAVTGFAGAGTGGPDFGAGFGDPAIGCF